MKKFWILIFSVLILSYAFSFSPSGSMKVGYSYDLENQTGSNYTELYLSGNNLSGEFTTKDLKLDSGYINLDTDLIDFKAYYNRLFGSTGDWMGIYTFDDDGEQRNGVEVTSFGFRGVIAGDVQYLQYRGNLSDISFSMMAGKHSSVNDIYFDFNWEPNLRYFGEVGVSYEEKVGAENFFYMMGISSVDWKHGVKITGVGSETRLDYCDFVNDNSLKGEILANLWTTLGDFKLWMDYRFKSKTPKYGFEYSINDFWFKAWKEGTKFDSDILNWDDFGMEVGKNFTFIGFNGKVSYKFGKPAHDSTTALGEVFYAELSRSFGNINFFAKWQYLNTLYTKDYTAYYELKVSQGSSEFKIALGDGDFSSKTTFQKKVTLEFSTWW
ncbi:hypothetical protein [Thermotoga neapolitana]|nr:hypothetical protein [Thermotoga neapolitana]KFZ21986.1 hypothetical protein LA10_03938 [Thermotoga neapolitana LA10]HBF10587.1 hypothetical protein [Thermotoga neapolitana]